MSKISVFCGSETPPQLMSTQNFLTLQFVAKSPQHERQLSIRNTVSDNKYRFLLHYRFVTDLGMKEMKAVRDTSRGTKSDLIDFTSTPSSFCSVCLYLQQFGGDKWINLESELSRLLSEDH